MLESSKRYLENTPKKTECREFVYACKCETQFEFKFYELIKSNNFQFYFFEQ